MTLVSPRAASGRHGWYVVASLLACDEVQQPTFRSDAETAVSFLSLRLLALTWMVTVVAAMKEVEGRRRYQNVFVDT